MSGRRGGGRPKLLRDVIGQGEAVDVLTRAVRAARERGDMPGHVLLTGPAGTGKTTLALCLANEMGGELHEVFGTGLRSGGDLLGELLDMDRRAVLFIDEIHRMWRPAQETLYPVMEDGVVLAGSQTLALPRMGRGAGLGYTVVGATTDPERLLSPMLSRFVWKVRLRLYTPAELYLIAEKAAAGLGVRASGEALGEVARLAGGVPRVAISIVRAARDYAGRDGRIDLADVVEVMSNPALIWEMEGRAAG